MTREILINEIEQLILHAEENEHLTYAVLEHARKLVFTARQENISQGIEMILQERQEQIEKHGRTIERDRIENDAEQLSIGAEMLLAISHEEGIDSDCFPSGWDHDLCENMLGKTYQKRLIIAGALIAAELDRLTS